MTGSLFRFCAFVMRMNNPKLKLEAPSGLLVLLVPAVYHVALLPPTATFFHDFNQLMVCPETIVLTKGAEFDLENVRVSSFCFALLCRTNNQARVSLSSVFFFFRVELRQRRDEKSGHVLFIYSSPRFTYWSYFFFIVDV